MTRSETLPLTVLISNAVGEYGPLPVFKATLAAALRTPTTGPEVRSLPDHLRKDVGLPEAVPERSFPEWMR
jgi:hypothetical protein